MRTRFIMAAALLGTAATISAQALPVMPPQTTSVLLPFNAPQVRYQQWYSAADLATLVPGPARISAARFFAGATSNTTTMLDVQVRMAHSVPSPTGFFDNNFSGNSIVVVPRQMVQLTAGVGINFNFDNPFPYDGVRDIVIDIQIFANQAGPAGTSVGFTDEFSVSNLAIGQTERFFNTTSATASFANNVPQPGVGLITLFSFLPGTTVPYGNGCPGEGGFVPEINSIGFPRPGFNWTVQLTNAASSRPAVLVAGFSDANWAGLPLPLPLGVVGSNNTPPGTPGIAVGGAGCDLLAAYDLGFFVVTTGAGAGGGVASHIEAIPPIGGLIGASVFCQWVVLDPNAPNGNFAASGGLQAIGGP